MQKKRPQSDESAQVFVRLSGLDGAETLAVDLASIDTTGNEVLLKLHARGHSEVIGFFHGGVVVHLPTRLSDYSVVPGSTLFAITQT